MAATARRHFAAIFGAEIGGLAAERSASSLNDYPLAWAEEAQAYLSRAAFLPAGLEGEQAMWEPVGRLFRPTGRSICPTWAVTGIPAGDSILGTLFDDGGPNDRQFLCFMTTPFNVLSPCPVLAVPSGIASNGVPTGRADRRAHVRRRERVPHRGGARAGAAVGGRAARGAEAPLSDLGAELQALVDREVQEWPQMPGRLLHVLAPDVDVDVEVASRGGRPHDRRAARARLTVPHRERTKPFVAAAALRLVEDRRLSLDATVAMLLPGEYDELLRSGGYDTRAITLRHLLTHTSGIYDFAADAYDSSIPDGFTSQVYLDLGRRWTRFEQVGFAVSHGAPYGPPGARFGYSDTGACLVGEVLERTTGLSMGSAIRELVGYERLGHGHTWQESVEPEPAGLPPLSHQYEGEYDVADMDPSVDLYGGGGLMSTCGDLARFFRGLPVATSSTSRRPSRR